MTKFERYTLRREEDGSGDAARSNHRVLHSDISRLRCACSCPINRINISAVSSKRVAATLLLV